MPLTYQRSLPLAVLGSSARELVCRRFRIILFVAYYLGRTVAAPVLAGSEREVISSVRSSSSRCCKLVLLLKSWLVAGFLKGSALDVIFTHSFGFGGYLVGFLLFRSCELLVHGCLRWYTE